MIVKERGFSLELMRMEALDRRLHSNHKMKAKVQLDLKRRRSGIRGEKEIEYPLRFLDEQRYHILHDLRLSDENGYFQIDTLILSESYILILEVKNWYGTILFGSSGQVTRIGDDGIEEGFPNPIPQAKLQQHRLRNWLHSSGISNIPIDYFVVISFPSTIIKSGSPGYPIPKQVVHNSQLLFEIQNLDQVYTAPKLGLGDLKILSETFIKSHTPSNINILDKYGITEDELIKGVICPACSAMPMVRKGQRWYCVKCCLSSTNAHLMAFNDYKLLIGNRISNSKARVFLQINAPYIVKHLLQKAGFNGIGRTSNRLYELEFR